MVIRDEARAETKADGGGARFELFPVKTSRHGLCLEMPPTPGENQPPAPRPLVSAGGEEAWLEADQKLVLSLVPSFDAHR